MIATDGVATTPRSIARQPTEASPAMAAWASIPPEGRPSRPRQNTGGLRFELSELLTKEPNAAANSAATSGVMERPTRPRAPETESISGDSDGEASIMWRQDRVKRGQQPKGCRHGSCGILPVQLPRTTNWLVLGPPLTL